MLHGDKKRLAARCGYCIRCLREEVGLSLKELAKATDLSSSFLSRVENGQTLPSLLTLHTIAHALHVDVESLLSNREERRFAISRRDNRNHPYSIKGPNQKTSYETVLLAHEMDSPLMEPAIVTALLRDRKDLELTSHGGQEFCYVIEGRIEMTLGSDRFVLESGDSAYWVGTIPHGAITLSEEPAKTLNIHLIPGRRIGTFQTKDAQATGCAVEEVEED